MEEGRFQHLREDLVKHSVLRQNFLGTTQDLAVGARYGIGGDNSCHAEVAFCTSGDGYDLRWGLHLTWGAERWGRYAIHGRASIPAASGRCAGRTEQIGTSGNNLARRTLFPLGEDSDFHHTTSYDRETSIASARLPGKAL